MDFETVNLHRLTKEPAAPTGVSSATFFAVGAATVADAARLDPAPARSA